ncbi:hypothetical protein TFLX_01948 [Thermoflexales bacterium]|nr:hypothetical protein TFLX_01948 [Thermoflexales bacterium]
MDDSDKLMNLIQKMSKAQLRQVTRFAEFILLDDEPDDLNDRSEMRTRYATFKDALQVDPAAIDAWAKSSSKK